MNEDAIQQDVSEVSTEGQTPAADAGAETRDEAQQDTRTEREKRMDEIADRLFQETAASEDGDEPEPVKDPEPRQEPPKDPTYKVKIEGEEQELPLSEILKGYQKDQTASRRLEEAAQARKQLEQEWARLQEERAKLTAPAAPKPEERPEPSADPKAAARKLYESLMLGDEDAGIDALSEFIAKREQPQADPAISVNQVASQAAEQARLQLEYSIAEKAFRKEFDDLARDPDLYQLAMNALQATAAQSSTYEEAFRAAGEQTRNWMKTKAEALGFVLKPADDKRQEKIARKQSLDSVQTAKARVPAPVEEREPTASELIADMRKARGLSI